ncbi:uncharacterized protein LOC133307174 [Gastrolobium bilobum]|uniref:uncharacterized protein LOC133307174 n=1 Tax=Gastrolobium bilobum TaxID=150636 RepID=UPI002AB307D3|nr:uncharacterized protein LOC133307174 [Gastrolobium bilobum]
MSVLAWNCRGVGKSSFPILIKDLKFRYKVSILALFEVKIGGARGEEIIRKLGFPNYYRQDPVGFSGGIWLLWEGSMVDVQVLDNHHQFIHTRVSYLESLASEFVTFVYGSPRRLERRSLWADLEAISSGVAGPWMVLGDFNAILKASEKIGGKDLCYKSMEEFNQCLIDCEISDLGYKGPDFTWKRGRLHERLDRVCANEAWSLAWDYRYVSHLPYYNSDHRPVLLCDGGHSAPVEHTRSFKFMAAWLTDSRFNDLVRNSFEGDVNWLDARNQFESEAKVWHQDVFKEEIKKKNRLYSRLNGLDSYRFGKYDHNTELLQKELWRKLQAILVQE